MAALPLVLILSILLLVFVVPRALFAFMGVKLKEHSSAAALKQVAELGVREKLALAEKEIKERIRRGVFPGQKQQSEKAEGSNDG